MYKRGFSEGFYNNNANPINLKMDEKSLSQ